LGSFIFQTITPPGRYTDAAWETLVVECEFEAGRFARARLTPLALNDEGVGGPRDYATRGRPSYAHGPRATRILARMAAQSPE